MIPATLREFISRVTRLTSNGELRWRERGQFDREVFECEQNGYVLHIGSIWNDDAEAMFIHFTIDMPDGSRANFSTSQWDDDYGEMRTILELASVSAANITPDSLQGFFGKS